MLTIDGSSGEGGGQILRTSLALSVVTGKPFVIENIRASRSNPGLRRQHLTAVGAAAEIGQAQVRGATLGSTTLGFTPTGIAPGDYHFSVGTAGSAMLVLETVLPPLLTAAGPSRLVLEGGTHNPHAPPFDFVDRAFLPVIRRMGPNVEARLVRHGFFPAGGGRVEVTFGPTPRLAPVSLTQRGRIVGARIVALVSRLPMHILTREIRTVLETLRLKNVAVERRQVDSPGPGNAVMVEIRSEHVTELFTGVGEKGVPAEKVAGNVVSEAQRYLNAGVPVGPYLADQLLLPMALAGQGKFLTVEPTTHTLTNLEAIRKFVDVRIDAVETSKGLWEIGVGT